jgi:hypothetical protein
MQEKLTQGAKFVGLTSAQAIIGAIVVTALVTYVVPPLRNMLLLPLSLWLTKPMIILQVTTTLALWIEMILALIALLVVGMLIRPLLFRTKIFQATIGDDIKGGVSRAQQQLAEIELLETRKASFSYLSDAEKILIRKFRDRGTKSLSCNPNYGTTTALVKAGIIYYAGIGNHMSTDHEYNISEWAWKLLQEHPELMD